MISNEMRGASDYENNSFDEKPLRMLENINGSNNNKSQENTSWKGAVPKHELVSEMEDGIQLETDYNEGRKTNLPNSNSLNDS
mmetsp:Transcript_13473/g.9705  ORF Transcript_13473/g.9705 Transcript_13473/m.9705 type:complete len:83 (+) Transcript_13473:226-474(+)